LNTYCTVPAIWSKEQEELARSVQIVTFASPSAVKIWSEKGYLHIYVYIQIYIFICPCTYIYRYIIYIHTYMYHTSFIYKSICMIIFMHVNIYYSVGTDFTAVVIGPTSAKAATTQGFDR
jgi:hypothetical protein